MTMRPRFLLLWVFGLSLFGSVACPAQSLRTLAEKAGRDLLQHGWVGDAHSGHILPTHGGLPINAADPNNKNDTRGVIWERAALICALEGLAIGTGDTELRQRIQAQWRFDKAQYSVAKLEACGAGSPSPWCDDAGWSLLYYVIAYQQSADSSALDHAKGLVRNMRNRWLDDQLGGGLWYNDQRKVKSLYGVAYVYGCLGIYEATHDAEYLNLALEEYRWLETHLLREDGLYWCEYSAGPPADADHPLGPVGINRPHQISPANSVTFLGGNMGMGACQAYLYKLTGGVGWRSAALRTSKALHDHLTDSAGRYINDRDAFTNGIFASFWARRMSALPGVTSETFTALRTTAQNIAAIRTADGFYPADWNGESLWESKGSTANKLHVSANSAAFLFAALYSDSVTGN